MGKLGALVGRIRSSSLQRKMPFVLELTDFDSTGVKFEIGNLVEHHRVAHHGDETEYTAAMIGALRPDDVFYDIGGNVGLVALHAASVCQTISFEPDPEFADRLRHNVSLNPDRHVQIEQLAISNSDGEVTLYTDGSGGNSPSMVHQRDEKGSVTVPTRSLDSIVSSGDLPVPTVLKLDIEGAEILALRGGRQFLASDRKPRALFIEVHASFLPGFGSSSEEVMKMLADFGYTRETYRAPRADQSHLILEAHD